MRRVLIGHRGAGKTTLLGRHQKYFRDIPHYDLDQVIAENEKQDVATLFSKKGEAHFRELEKSYFQDLIKQNEFVISLGAGFPLQLIPNTVEVVFVSRRTDVDGRIFLNRPRLEPQLSPIEEYQKRFEERDKNFRKRADWVYHMPEGISESKIEEQILNGNFKIKNQDVFLTLSPTLNRNYPLLFPCLEIRTDHFKNEEIEMLLQKYSQKKVMVSYRIQDKLYYHESKATHKPDLYDWALELGEVPDTLVKEIHRKAKAQLVLSCHDLPLKEAADALKASLLKINTILAHRVHLKLCPLIHSWEELEWGQRWQQQNIEQRSFLPRTPKELSPRSLWKWFRCLQAKRQKINFVQGLADLDDQPSVYDYLYMQGKIEHRFGAVLGYPVHHSRTPLYQTQKFVKGEGLIPTILPIPVKEDDFEVALVFLRNMGLSFAAVTSPLKRKASDICGGFDQSSINSLALNLKNKWVGTSTDEVGFENLVKCIYKENLDLDKIEIAVWGGGGVLGPIKKILPKVIEYSARTGDLRQKGFTAKGHIPPTKIDVLIWAAPRHEDVQFPSPAFKPKLILDLNYSDNSMGLEYAQKTGAKYVSGLAMFEAQADKQYDFFSKFFK